jgi:hypothetical protein
MKPTQIPHITSRKLDKKENKNLDVFLAKRLDRPQSCLFLFIAPTVVDTPSHEH